MNRCYRCQAKMVRDHLDLYCLSCGFRLDNYFGKADEETEIEDKGDEKWSI